MKQYITNLFVAIVLLLVCGAASHADTFVVTSLADDGGPGELRAAMTAANGSPGSTITFSNGLSGTLTLTSSLPEIYTTTTIKGPGASVLAIDAAGHNLPFYINAPTCTVKISGLTMQHGSGSLSVLSGGSILVGYGLLWLDSCVIENNTTVGIWNYSLLTMTNCTVANNNGGPSGGYGGGFYNYGVANVSDSTFVGNAAGGYDGGAIYSPGYNLTVTNCTFTGNSAARGGAIENVNSNHEKLGATITNCTIVGNTATINGAGIENLFDANTVVQNCIVYNDYGATEIGSDSGPNAIATYCDVQGGYAGTGNIDADPQLGLLANNGGPTQTMTIGASSPCLGAGSAIGAPSTDQRGLQRPAQPSIGAYDQGVVPAPTFSPGTGAVPTGQAVVISDAFAGSAVYYTVNGTAPTTQSTLYAGPVTVSTPETIRAIAVAPGFASSALGSASYTLGPTHIFQQGLAMFSVPSNYDGRSIAQILGYAAPVLALWDPGSSQYDVTPATSVDSLALGVGYWVRFPQAAIVDVPSTPTPTILPVLIPLKTGWNMIGDPFPTDVPLSAVMVSLYVQGPGTWLYQAAAGAGWVGQTVWGFASGNYYSATDLEPYSGYWVYANQDCTLVVPPST